MAHVLATFGQFERRLISQHTKEALAVKKAAGSGSAVRQLCRQQSSAGSSGSVIVVTHCERSRPT
jgi:DNA invertase Pin-like site-specific DNA recombinase